MNQITVQATVKEIATITEYVDLFLEKLECPMKAQMQIDVALDEIFSNIANYAYGGEKGEATVGIEELPGAVGVKIVFTDGGVPYNPLAKEDPDVTLSADERPIGGLGIYIVKKTMDSVEYEHKDGKNILTITKNF